MADPATIIGLISGIITFVEFGFKVAGGARQILESGDGTTQELAELDSIVENIRRSNSEVKAQISICSKPSGDEKNVLKMVNQCEALTSQLRKLITKLTARNSSIIEAGRVAVQATWKKNDIERIKNRLIALQDQIRATVQDAFQENRHGSIMANLRAVQHLQQDIGIEQQYKLDAVKDEIISLTNNLAEKSNKDLKAQIIALNDLSARLDDIQMRHAAALEQIQVLESLYFVEIRRRFDQIPDAQKRTNEWVYDPIETTFASWLESAEPNDGLFYVFGKAGSGKSTLMKHISEAEETEQRLKKWADNQNLHIGSFYFWYQGSEMQRSLTALLQSLLYQILCASPELAPEVALGRMHYEVWDKKSLQKAFELVTKHRKLDTKYCFFIDGLDEYDGNENDVVEMLETLSFSPSVKICASSRPLRTYERYLYDAGVQTKERVFDIAKYTKADMKTFVYERLHSSERFRDLAYPTLGSKTMHPDCEKIIAEISKAANGVWLWVFLVTRQLIQQVERNESLAVLRKIVKNFPADLEKFFERIIEKIDDIHKEEMAQIFLVAADELQPLPLYALHLLEKLRENPEYAVQEQIDPLEEAKISLEYETWTSRLWNRCGDLLVVGDGPHPVFLSYPIDFLHRTVRDFLRSSYQAELRSHLKTNFDPQVALCNISLCLLKGLPDDNFRGPGTGDRILGLTDELLYYAHEAEKQHPEDPDTSFMAVLDELDRVNSYFARHIDRHWTHARDSPHKQGFDKYSEGGNCNFLALTVQARLVKYVRAKLQSTPSSMQKRGRPLLDYALRPLRTTPIMMPYHTYRDDPSVDIDMIELLLHNGADPNQEVYLNDGETVWGLFLISISSTREKALDNLKKAWYRACLALIQAGAQPDYAFVHKRYRSKQSVSTILHEVFGPEKTAMLEAAMEAHTASRNSQRNSCRVM